MELRINKIRLENFKGVKKKEIVLNGKSARLCAQNGGFKTTTGDAWFFVMSNCNTAMVNNPDVVPIGAEEVKPTVEIEMTIDGKPITVKKVQTFKRKENTSSVTNTYYINDVEKSQKDFIADLTERGIDMDNFLMLSNPNAFMADTSKQGREKMRNILFEMCENISDEQIISEMKNVEELKVLLENYKLDECEQMQKSTLKKINDEFGKDNSLIQARISGIIQSKSPLDIKELEKTKKEYETELEQVRKDFNALRNKDSGVEAKIAELEGKCDDLERAETRKLEERKASVSEKLRKVEEKCKELNYDVVAEKSAADRILQDLDGVKESLEHYRAIYKKTQDEVFDKDATVCPTCGRAFPKLEVEEMKKKFEESKTKRLSDYKKMGEMFKVQVDTYEAEYKDQMAKHDKKHKDWLKADEEVAKLTEQYRGIPTRPNMADNSEYQKLRSEIDSLRVSLSNQDDDFKLSELSKRESYLTHMIIQTNGEIAVVERNKDLDRDIAELRKQQKDAEIRRANAEKILDQVDRFKREKNEKLTSDINSHFKIINWHLWKYKKNGEYEEIVEPFIGCKGLNSHSNQALQVVSKLDIIDGISRFFNISLPVFIDDASLLTQDSIEKINLKNQLIYLCARDGYKELTIENAEIY